MLSAEHTYVERLFFFVVASLYFLLTGKQIAPSHGWDSRQLYDVFDAIEDFELPPRIGFFFFIFAYIQIGPISFR